MVAGVEPAMVAAAEAVERPAFDHDVVSGRKERLLRHRP
jgi:hypothetical protein